MQNHLHILCQHVTWQYVFTFYIIHLCAYVLVYECCRFKIFNESFLGSKSAPKVSCNIQSIGSQTQMVCQKQRVIPTVKNFHIYHGFQM